MIVHKIHMIIVLTLKMRKVRLQYLGTLNTLPKASNLYPQTQNLGPEPAGTLNPTLSPKVGA